MKVVPHGSVLGHLGYNAGIMMEAPRLDLTGRLRALGDFLRAHRSIWSGVEDTALEGWPCSLRSFLDTHGEKDRDATAILDSSNEGDSALPAEARGWSRRCPSASLFLLKIPGLLRSSLNLFFPV